jgi:hypothetical protein
VTIDVTLRFVLSTKIIRRTTWRRFGDDAAGDDGGDLLPGTRYVPVPTPAGTVPVMYRYGTSTSLLVRMYLG